MRKSDATPAAASTSDGQAAPQAADRAAAETMVEDFLQSDRVGIEIGARLIPWAKSGHGHALVDRVMGLRRDLARKNGVWVPSIRIRDNIQLNADAYRF